MSRLGAFTLRACSSQGEGAASIPSAFKDSIASSREALSVLTRKTAGAIRLFDSQKSPASSMPISSISLRTSQTGCEVITAICAAGSFSGSGQFHCDAASARLPGKSARTEGLRANRLRRFAAAFSGRLAQNCVYELDNIRGLAAFGDVNRIVYGCVVRHAVEKQNLIEGQPKEDPYSRSDLVGPRPAKLIDVPVEPALPAHNTIYKLGEKRPVTLIEPRVALEGGPDQPVGMGSLLLDVQQNLVSEGS